MDGYIQAGSGAKDSARVLEGTRPASEKQQRPRGTRISLPSGPDSRSVEGRCC